MCSKVGFYGTSLKFKLKKKSECTGHWINEQDQIALKCFNVSDLVKETTVREGRPNDITRGLANPVLQFHYAASGYHTDYFPPLCQPRGGILQS